MSSIKLHPTCISKKLDVLIQQLDSNDYKSIERLNWFIFENKTSQYCYSTTDSIIKFIIDYLEKNEISSDCDNIFNIINRKSYT